MNKTAKILLVLILVLSSSYGYLFHIASNGYGYTGYHGYHRGPSFWYFGGPSTYHDRNVRSNVGGSNVRGGGPGSGK